MLIEANPPATANAWGDEPYSIKRHGVTITNCDAEPIRTPGCIQSHGALLALRRQDSLVLQVSENVERHLGRRPAELLQRPVDALFSAAELRRIRHMLVAEPVERNPTYAFTFTPAGGRALDVSLHTVDDVVLLEFEPTDRAGAAPPDYYAIVKHTLARLQASGSVKDFCQILAREVRVITGLDRCMVYRFHEDHSGEVFAEAARADLPAWLGLRYPAEDIPLPAREIYKKLWVRPVPDAESDLAELVPLLTPESGRPLELTHCALRGASVMYTEYIRNMGVAASLTMPLLRDGELWGLIACHHSVPAAFPWQVRAACEFVAQVASVQFRNAEDREQMAYRVKMDSVHDALLARAAGEDGLAALVDGPPTLADGLACGGAALFHRGRWWTAGRTPAEHELDPLVDWLCRTSAIADAARPLYATDALPAAFPPAHDYAAIASGLLAVPVSREGRSFLLWFRPETAQTVSWAGNPHDKPTVTGPHGPRLTPRRSFELWHESVRERASPWHPVELDAALRLRLLVMELVVSRAEQLATLNTDLSRSNAELDAFAFVASHDLKEPLRGINKHASQLLTDEHLAGVLDPRGRERLEAVLRLTVRMDGLLDSLLHFSRVGRLSLEFEDVPLGALVREAIEMLGARVEDCGAVISVSNSLPTLPCDRVRVREIYANLIANALKYNDGPNRAVEVGALTPEEAAARFGERLPKGAAAQAVLFVRDNGIGIDARHHERVFQMFKRLHPRDAYGGGAGVGLAIVRKLIDQHGGMIWIDSARGEGTTFWFVLGSSAP